jgi:hypothetical protein
MGARQQRKRGRRRKDPGNYGEIPKQKQQMAAIHILR